MSKVDLAGEDFVKVINDVQANSIQSIFGQSRKKREAKGSSYNREIRQEQASLKDLESASRDLSSGATRKESETRYEVHHRQKRDQLCKYIFIFGNTHRV